MKHCLLFFTCVLLLSTVSAVCAQEENHFSTRIGLQAYHHEYKEPGIMTNKGLFGGVAYGITYENKVMAELDGFFAYGQVEYSSNESGDNDGIDDLCADNRLLLGYKIFDDKKTQVTPYIGVGYRFLSDDSENERTTTGHWGYLRESNYYYSPIGIRINVQYGNGWSLSPELEYDYFWKGEQESYIGYITGDGDVKNDQKEGFGYRASLTLAKKSETMGYSFNVFYRYWEIDDSQVTFDNSGQGWTEPLNKTSEIGFNITILFLK